MNMMEKRSLEPRRSARGAEPLQRLRALPEGEARPRGAVSVVIPAFNEERGIGDTIRGVLDALREYDVEVIAVDDGSKDDTGAVAAAAGARVIRHPYNKGYGAALKTGLREARHDICAFIDADGQHDPSDLARVIARLDGADMVVGMRADAGSGYSHVRGFGNLMLNRVASYLTGQRVPDVTSGLRAFRRPIFMQYSAILPNQFSISTTSTLAFLTDGYSVVFEPIHVKARLEGTQSTLKPTRDGMKFLTLIVRVIHLFNPLKIYLPLGAGVFTAGVLQSIRTMIKSNEFSAGGIFLLLTGLLLVLMGFQIDQVASLRRQLGRAGS